MITQAIFDFFRDVIVNWIGGLNTLTEGIDAAAAGGAIGGVAGQAGHVLSLFIGPGSWGALVAAWGVWMLVWITTALVAIIGRRLSS